VEFGRIIVKKIRKNFFSKFQQNSEKKIEKKAKISKKCDNAGENAIAFSKVSISKF